MIRALAAASAALLLAVAGCQTNPATGEREIDTVATLELLSLAGAIVQITAGDDEPLPDVIDYASTGVEDGIAQFCAMDPWDKETVRRQLDARDPTIRPYLIERYGGADGDVCTGRETTPPPSADTT